VAEDTLFTVCAACGAKNRLPLARLTQTGRCGRCRESLPPGVFYAEDPIAVDDRHFDLVTRTGRLPVLVDFSATWCAPCKQMEPVLAQLAHELAGRLLVVKVDTERAAGTAARFGVQAVPTFVVLRSGLEVDRVSGALPLAALRQRVERFLIPASA